MVATLGLSQDLGQGEQDGQLASKVLIERYNELMIGMRNGRILPIANIFDHIWAFLPDSGEPERGCCRK